MQRATTTKSVGSLGTNLGNTLTGIDVRSRTTQEGAGGKVFVVGYEGNHDSMNPHNWGRTVRVRATLVLFGLL